MQGLVSKSKPIIEEYDRVSIYFGSCKDLCGIICSTGQESGIHSLPILLTIIITDRLTFEKIEHASRNLVIFRLLSLVFSKVRKWQVEKVIDGAVMFILILEVTVRHCKVPKNPAYPECAAKVKVNTCSQCMEISQQTLSPWPPAKYFDS